MNEIAVPENKRSALTLRCGLIALDSIAIPVGMAIFFGGDMETRIAVVGIIVEDMNSVETLNAVLHEYGKYIIGRMGIPYREKSVSVVSIAVDAPQDVISTLTGKIGNINGISVKTAYSNVTFKE